MYTHSEASSICKIICWKCSESEESLNVSLLKQNRPYGIMNVVRGDDLEGSGICQKAEFASCLYKILAPES